MDNYDLATAEGVIAYVRKVSHDKANEKNTLAARKVTESQEYISGASKLKENLEALDSDSKLLVN